VIDRPLFDLLESGSSSLVVGVLDPDGEPFATRAWGLQVLSADPMSLRVLLPTGSLARIGRSSGDGSSFPMALTAADVPTLQSLQVKGTARDLDDVTDEDLARFDAYREEFFRVINRTDGYDPEVLERWAPTDLTACTMDVRETFDQSPGPGAGAPVQIGQR
jgi:hypothetical protein